MRIALAVIAAVCVSIGCVGFSPPASEAQPAKVQKWRHPRGHIHAPKHVHDRRHRLSTALHAAKLKALPVITAATWDTVALGYGPAINDQGQCGDCYVNSGCNVCASAQMIAGVVPSGSGFTLSWQYFLDCQNVGGCGGGDEYQVAQIILSGGCPSAAQYTGQGQTPGQCQSTAGMTLYMVSSLVMCSDTSGVAKTQDVKNCVAAYGYVSVAVAANDDWDSYQPGTVMSGPPDPNGINHAVGIVGWKTDTDATIIWKMQNSWGTSWGNNGYAWVKEGSYSLGTEAFAAIATAAPIPPGPTPPSPGPAPGPTSPPTITITGTLPAGTYEILPGGTTQAVTTVVTDVGKIPAPLPSSVTKCPMPTPVDPTLGKRLGDLEAGVIRLADAVDRLQKLVGGGNKEKQ